MSVDNRDKASLFGAAVAVHRQLSTKLSGLDRREALWEYVQWLEGNGEPPDGDTANILKSMDMVEQIIKDNAP